MLGSTTKSRLELACPIDVCVIEAAPETIRVQNTAANAMFHMVTMLFAPTSACRQTVRKLRIMTTHGVH
jgi:hypothetical protein